MADQNPTVVVCVATFLLGSGQALQVWASHKKGKRRDTASSGTLERIEGKLDASIEEHRAFAADTLETFGRHQLEIAEVSSHVIGPDGKNGVRSRVEALERWRDEERRVGPRDRRESA